MDFLAAILFLILYFVRPQEWVPAIEGLNVIKAVIALGVLGLMSREKRLPRWKWMSTPHEWVMVAYLAHGLWVDPDWIETSSAVFTMAAFFFLTSQTLTDPQKLVKFFTWWMACVVFMCLVGVAVDFGVDLTGARELIDGQLGRLCLNTSLLDNPNALGHTAATGIPLIYLMLIFRRDVGMRLMALPLMLIVGMCIVATQSKGAYISSAAGTFAGILVGRSMLIQISMGTLLAVGGSMASSALPRMADRTAMQFDEGIMGRALAFIAARSAYEFIPCGWSRFIATIQWQGETVEKATHSSFVQVGADQGPVGLFLFVGVLVCGARATLTLRTESDDLERCRRLLFALIVGYFVSGWMINRSYHAEFFLLAGAIVAFHKLAREQLAKQAGVELNDEGEPVKGDEPVPVFAVSAAEAGAAPAVVVRKEEGNVMRRVWMRLGVLDAVIVYGVFNFVLWLWDYLIDYFVPT